VASFPKLLSKRNCLASALICGLARNCAGTLHGCLAEIEVLRRSFDHSEVIIVTNDSSDATSTILSDLTKSASARLICADGLISSVPGRTDRLAIARNFYLLELKNRIDAGQQYDLLIVLDLDGVNNNLVKGKEFLDALSSAPPDWAAVFANQRQAYYDIWALRHENWCPTDCWKEVKAIAAKAASRWGPGRWKGRWYENAHRAASVTVIGQRQVQIPPTAPPIEVASAFGGFGIYKTTWLKDTWYGSRDSDGYATCEHVILNQQIHGRGGKLYVLPQLLNDAPATHLFDGSGSSKQPWLVETR
jgi:hypothetical protein